MKISLLVFAIMLVLGAVYPLLAQAAPQQNQTQPLYQVTVVERTIKAVNYQYRSGPTKIDFRGTVLLPEADGEANVESKRGRTVVDAKFDDLPAPSRFGREYLAYVLWAITPDGRPHNLGEIIPNSKDDARTKVTTDLQAFAMIVTAEPYAAVRMPSDVVVLQNEVRPDTLGRIETVSVKYGLMPRGHYVYNKPDEKALAQAGGPEVSMSRYEELLALYQAQNAIGIAGSEEAGRYAPEVYAKAQQLLSEARQLEQNKGGSKRVVQIARQAAETAEDARVLAGRLKQQEKLADAEQARLKAEVEARQAREDAAAAVSRAQAEREARLHAEAEAARARKRAAEAPVRSTQPVRTVITSPINDRSEQTSLRLRLLNDLNVIIRSRDTPAGIVATIPDNEFRGADLQDQAAMQLARIGGVLANYPGLTVSVEGHSDNSSDAAVAEQRAAAVRDALRSRGLSPSMVTSIGRGDSKPLVSNTTASGREQNRRVEIVISGDPIGNMATWDRAYTIVP